MNTYYKLAIVSYVNGKRTYLWGQSHKTVLECLTANADYIANNLGKEFFVQRFTEPTVATQPVQPAQ